MAVQVPDELMVEILSILPAKSLVRFQLVCKSWLSLINSTKFKLMHLHNFNQLNPRYFVRRLDYNVGKELYNVHLDDEALTIDDGTLVQFPFNSSEGCRIIGCCNGVVCLSDDDQVEYRLDGIILWNPSIRRKLTLTLPMFPLIELEDLFVVLGFGYDKMSDDYKVVCLTYDSFLRPHQVQVYAMKIGIWREVRFPDDLSCLFILPNSSQLFFNGSVHWIASDRRSGNIHRSIMTFDTSSEIFGEILLPDVLVEGSGNTMVISVVGESLAVIYSNRQTRGSMSSSTYKIWVMKEYKNPTSWIMIYNMHYPDIDMGKPLQLRNKADMIMESRDVNMIIHDYNPSDICIGYVSELDRRTYVEKYQESLVLLDVGDSLPNDD